MNKCNIQDVFKKIIENKEDLNTYNNCNDILLFVISMAAKYLKIKATLEEEVASLREIEEFIESSYKLCIKMIWQKKENIIKKTVFNDYIICLEDGAHVVLLKPYLARKFNMTPEAYRIKWNLSHDYPMTAPNYKKKRRYFAKKNKLGEKKQ